MKHIDLIHRGKIIFITAVATAILVAGTQLYAAWSAPVSAPPESNIATPLHTGPSYQQKLGDLGATRMQANEYCDLTGSVCFDPSTLGVSTTTELDLPEGTTYYQCPNIDNSGGMGSCGSGCNGQIGTADFCTDYEQYKQKSRDRRCRVQAVYACSYMTGPEPTSSYEWYTGPWEARTETVCTRRGDKNRCSSSRTVNYEEREVYCEDTSTNTETYDALCPDPKPATRQ